MVKESLQYMEKCFYYRQRKFLFKLIPMHDGFCPLQFPDLSHLLDSSKDLDNLCPKSQWNSANVCAMYPSSFRVVL